MIIAIYVAVIFYSFYELGKIDKKNNKDFDTSRMIFMAIAFIFWPIVFPLAILISVAIFLYNSGRK